VARRRSGGVLVEDARAALRYLARQPEPERVLKRRMLRLRGLWREHYLRLPYRLTVKVQRTADDGPDARATRRLLAWSVGLEVHDEPGELLSIRAHGAGRGKRRALRRVRVQGKGRAQTLAYLERGRIEPGRGIVDGFALPSSRNTASLSRSGMITNVGEVVVVDRRRDRRLARHLAHARTLRKLPEQQRAAALDRYVHALLTPKGWDRERIGDGLRRWTTRFNNRGILLGDVIAAGVGVCRHQALLFKVLGEEAGLRVALVAGMMRLGDRSGGHAWNEIQFSGQPARFVVDLLHPVQRGYPEVEATSLHAGTYLTEDGRPMYAIRSGPPPAPTPRRSPRRRAAAERSRRGSPEAPSSGVAPPRAGQP
jgi:hypothetical protein